MEFDDPPRLPTPSPDLEPQPRRSQRRRQFPQLWKEFEATLYTPVMEVLQVDEQVYEGRVELPVVDEGPVMLATPDMARPSPNRSPVDAFRVCCVFDRPITAPLSGGGQAHLPKQVPIPSPLAHPF